MFESSWKRDFLKYPTLLLYLYIYIIFRNRSPPPSNRFLLYQYFLVGWMCRRDRPSELNLYIRRICEESFTLRMAHCLGKHANLQTSRVVSWPFMSLWDMKLCLFLDGTIISEEPTPTIYRIEQDRQCKQNATL